MNFKCYFVIWVVVLVTPCVYGITIDGQITVIKNDCYERMAIGEKLSPKQIYKIFDHNTVQKCEMECTQEKETCRAFSFGIGLKGNATCLLSRNPIKETANLKPIGTISDTDYDLYTKKLDCQVVLEPHHFDGLHGPVNKPQNVGPKPQHSKDVEYGQNGHPVQEHHNEQDKHYGVNGNLPAQSNYFNYVSNPNKVSENGYQYDKPNNPYSPQELPQNNPVGNNLHHVQTLVSIASGPQTVLHPVLDILVAGDAYGQGKPQLASQPGGNGYGNHNDNVPPFRPPALNHPYDAPRPRPQVPSPQRPPTENYDKPGRPYSEQGNLKPGNSRPGAGYEPEVQDYLSYNRPISSYPNDFGRPYRPETPPYGQQSHDDRPDPEYGSRPPPGSGTGYGSGSQFTIDRRKYESANQFNSFESETFRYGGPEHQKRYPSDYNFYDNYDKPSPDHHNRYGSVIPHPNDYSRPNQQYDYLFVRPNSEPYNDRGPPLRPSRPEYDYRKPGDISGDVNQGYGRPNKPYRISFDDANYGAQKPMNAGGDIQQEYGKPIRPTPDNTNERYPNRYDQSDPSKPNNSPSADSYSSTSRPPSTELSNHYGGVDYTNKQYGKPGEYLNVKDDGGTRKIVTQSVGYHGEKITSIITELKNGWVNWTDGYR